MQQRKLQGAEPLPSPREAKVITSWIAAWIIRRRYVWEQRDFITTTQCKAFVTYKHLQNLKAPRSSTEEDKVEGKGGERMAFRPRQGHLTARRIKTGLRLH